MFWSIPNVVATLRAAAERARTGSREDGFAGARRWSRLRRHGGAGVYPSRDTGPGSRRSSLRTGPSRRVVDHAQAVGAARAGRPRPAPSQPERVAAGQHVAQPGEQAEPLAASPELDIELRERAQLGGEPARSRTWPSLDGEHGRARGRTARKLLAESVTRPISAEPWAGGPPPTGTKIRPPPDTSSRVRPSIAPSLRGTTETRAVSVTTPCAPGGRRSRVGFAIDRDAGDPLDRGRHLDRDAPGGDIADGDPANGLPAGSSAVAEADRRRICDHLGRTRCRRIDDARTLRRRGAEPGSVSRCRRERPSTQPRRARDGSVRAPQPLHRRGRRSARAADRPVPGGLICVPPRIGGHQLDAGDRDLRLDAAAEGQAVRRERRHAA